jgi:hypothetical protein
MRIVTLLMVLALLGGCAAGVEHWVFDKPGVADADLKRDRSECFAASVETVKLGGLFRLDREAYRSCMEQRGYTLRVEP